MERRVETSILVINELQCCHTEYKIWNEDNIILKGFVLRYYIQEQITKILHNLEVVKKESIVVRSTTKHCLPMTCY